MVAKPFDGYPAEFYRHGIRAAIVSIQRNSPESLPPSIKSISCLNGVLAKIESTRVKAQEGIMLDAQGHVSEGTVSNIFAVKNNTLLTPQLDGGLLAGVTRARVLRLARRAGYKTIEKKIVPRDLFNADEIFLTSTLMGVMPVRELLWKGKVCFRARHFAATMQLASICKQ
jgi:branched-chain amino acid aminotransferase